MDALSARQLEILKLMAQGMRAKEIALVLGITEQTVKNHCAVIREKLKAKSMAHAVYLVFCTGDSTGSELPNTNKYSKVEVSE